MTYHRAEMIEKKPERKRRVIPRSKNQYCPQASDNRIREIIRAFDRHERLIALDELEKIYAGE